MSSSRWNILSDTTSSVGMTAGKHRNLGKISRNAPQAALRRPNPAPEGFPTTGRFHRSSTGPEPTVAPKFTTRSPGPPSIAPSTTSERPPARDAGKRTVRVSPEIASMFPFWSNRAAGSANGPGARRPAAMRTVSIPEKSGLSTPTH